MKDVHSKGGANEDELPEVGPGGRGLPAVKARLGPAVGEVYEEDQTEEDEKGGADGGWRGESESE